VSVLGSRAHESNVLADWRASRVRYRRRPFTHCLCLVDIVARTTMRSSAMSCCAARSSWPWCRYRPGLILGHTSARES